MPIHLTNQTDTGYNWVQDTGTASGSTVTIWTTWINTTSAGMNEYNYPVWTYWSDNTGTLHTSQPAGAAYEPRQSVNSEELRRRGEERQREYEEARARAKRLLLDSLSLSQVKQMNRGKYFDVMSEGRWFRIHTRGSIQGNVVEITNGRPSRRYCIHHDSSYIPAEDTWLHQKLLIEADLSEFERRANITRIAA